MTPTDPTTAGKTPKPDQVEAETRAEFLHLHKAPKDWLIVTESEVASLKAELAAKDAELAQLREDRARLEGVILWALGEGDGFPMWPESVTIKGNPKFWWRTELRKRYDAAREGRK